MRFKLGPKSCKVGAKCKSSCISRDKDCLVGLSPGNKAKVQSATVKLKQNSSRLVSSKAKTIESNLFAKRGIKRIRYASRLEILTALGVYSKEVKAIKAGTELHPYINMDHKVSAAKVDRIYSRLKKENPELYTKLAKGLGVRKDSSGYSPNSSEKVKLAIAIYLQQDGRSFATGKVVSINRLSLDHLVPLSAGGKNTVDNLVLIESSINYVKGAKSLKTFEETLRKKSLQVNSPEDLSKLKKAVESRDQAKIKAVQKELQTKNRAAVLEIDKTQAANVLARAKAKIQSLSQFGALNELGVRAYARYDNETAINSLTPKDLQLVTKVQAATGSGIARWFRGPNAKGSQTEYVTGNAIKAQVFLNNGGSWKDLPLAWKEEFKNKYQENINTRSKAKVLAAYGNKGGRPEWLI